jgi:hypothetical protein
VLELELESPGGDTLETALEYIKAVAETTAYRGVKTSFRVMSSLPPGDPALSEKLLGALLDIMGELKIKAEVEAKPDPSSVFAAPGIPALSLGMASGREGLHRDTVEIASIEKGRQLLERLIVRLGGPHEH